MNIKQALKARNVLVTELNELYNLIRQNNSYVVGNPRHFNVAELMVEANTKLVELVELKMNIHKANIPVHGLIFLLSELKTKVNQYKGISTTEGKQTNRYSQEEPVMFEVEFNVKQVKDFIKSNENRINEIQDELDTFNSITQV